jgi:hypothetical protein
MIEDIKAFAIHYSITAGLTDGLSINPNQQVDKKNKQWNKT